MKQNPYSAQFRTQLLLTTTAAFVIINLACVTLSRSSTPRSQPPQPANGNTVRLNINEASALELEKLPGIGEVIAERIVAHREQYGPFRRPEHVMMVRGISEQKYRKIQPMIVAE